MPVGGGVSGGRGEYVTGADGSGAGDEERRGSDSSREVRELRAQCGK